MKGQTSSLTARGISVAQIYALTQNIKRVLYNYMTTRAGNYYIPLAQLPVRIVTRPSFSPVIGGCGPRDYEDDEKPQVRNSCIPLQQLVVHNVTKPPYVCV